MKCELLDSFALSHHHFCTGHNFRREFSIPRPRFLFPTAVMRLIASAAVAIIDKCKDYSHRRDHNAPIGVVLIVPVISLKIRACACSISPPTIFIRVLGHRTMAVCSYLGLSIALYITLKYLVKSKI